MAAVSSVSVSLDTSGKLQEAVKRLLKQEALVGIPDSTAERQPEPKSAHAVGVEAVRRALGGVHEIGVGAVKDALAAGAPSNAVLGYINEFGDDERNIPARPFLIPGVADAKDDIVKRMQKAGEATLTGDPAAVDKGLNAVGLVTQAAVQAKITNGPFTPLAERTLQARRARGRTGEKPLIDTGQLRRAVNYVVRNKGA